MEGEAPESYASNYRRANIEPDTAEPYRTKSHALRS